MYALVDCNNFFVSCERVFRPELEGKAVVVLSNNDGCVVSRSNESKAMGIKMGTPFFKVKHLVDNGALIACSSNYALYGDLSSRVMSILAEEAPKIEVYSIDEAFLILDGLTEQQMESLCRKLIAKIRKWVGIPISIGIAPTKTLAKVAGTFAKKYKGYRGCCMINTPEKIHKALELIPIGDVWGIGRKLAPKLNASGVKTALDFIKRPREWVAMRYHLPAVRTWEELQGRPCVEEDKHDRRQSICTSRSFADMITDEKELSMRVSDFAAACAKKLRDEKSAAYSVTTFVYTNRFREDLDQYFPSATIRLEVAENTTQTIVSTALRALNMIYRSEYKYKKAGVIVSNIIPAENIQNTLFDKDQEYLKKQAKISQIMDSVEKTTLLRVAMQRPGHYSDGIRSDFKSRLYTTSLNELIEIH